MRKNPCVKNVYFSFPLWIVLFLSLAGRNSLAQEYIYIKVASDESISNTESILKSALTTSQVRKNANPVPPKISKFQHISESDSDLHRILKLELKDIDDTELFIANLRNNPAIEYVQEPVTYTLDYTPNDSLVGDQWALTNIQAFDAYQYMLTHEPIQDTIIVGVIDTGVDYLHEDLQANIYYNPVERQYPDNGIDDDGNGFIDDHIGWDFTDRAEVPFDSSGGDYLHWDNDPMDEHGSSHGTAVSGIIAAQYDNDIGIAGLSPYVKILCLRAFDPTGNGDEEDVAAAILYAVDAGAKVINMSFGDESFSYVLRDVIRYAASKGVILVASSGNKSVTTPHYPSGYSEVISVGNSTNQDYVSSNSSYGSTLDLVAPGTSILTTAIGNKYREISGTSFAAPHVSAAAAMILAYNDLTPEDVRQILKATTDDIDATGWDIRSGSGRLNLFKALTLPSPAIVRFDYPFQDLTTDSDTLNIITTILSPYFIDYSISIGIGHAPENWEHLLVNDKTQHMNRKTLELDLNKYSDTTYTLRIALNQSNGRTLEERVSFHISRDNPEASLISLISALSGDRPTIISALHSSEPSVARMYYRMKGENEFRFVTLDGFTLSNQFIKEYHYGFLPSNTIRFNTEYELFYEVEDLKGNSVRIDNNGQYYSITTNESLQLLPAIEKGFSLPSGYLFKEPVQFTSDKPNQVLLRETESNRTTRLYTFTNNQFVREENDTLENRAPKDYGDFNNNGKNDLLSIWSTGGYLGEQTSANSFLFNESVVRDTSQFRPILAEDIDNDGITELLAITKDDEVSLYEIFPDLTLSLHQSVKNSSRVWVGGNIFDAPHGVIADTDGDNRNELWMVDMDGDILIWDIGEQGKLVEKEILQTDFLCSSAHIAAGDYDGDGIDDIAILLQSIEEQDIAPYHRLVVMKRNTESGDVAFIDRAFLNPASQSFSGAFSSTSNALEFYNIDKDDEEELILFAFPYTYIFSYNNNQNDIIHFDENVNANMIYGADLDENGIIEIAFPKADKISFYEFEQGRFLPIPNLVKGHSSNSENISLTWQGEGASYQIYRGTTVNNMSLYDSTSEQKYSDNNTELGKTYFYSIRAISNNIFYSSSGLSNSINVYHHIPAKATKIREVKQRSFIVSFSDRVPTVIENLDIFNIFDNSNNTLGVNSITPADQFSYLVTLKSDIAYRINYLTLNGMTDFYGSPVQNDTLLFEYIADIKRETFYIVSFEILNEYVIRIDFNLPPDKKSAENISNYTFYPEIDIHSIELMDDAPGALLVDLSGGKPIGSVGREYRLSISNIRSSKETGSIPIQTGAGSEIILSTFKDDLKEVYVYPNPVKISSGQTILTFANLPQFAEIWIWNINGKKIAHLEENDGNGGVNWNLRDETGTLCNTGIYLFRIIQKDQNNNEISSETGKFTIIR